MQTRIKHRFETMERSVQLAKEHPSGLARVIQLIDSLEAIVAQIYACHADQDSGHLAFRSGAAVRALRAAELLELMRSVNRIGRSVNPAEFPGLREQLRMPRGDGYGNLTAHAAAFIKVATENKDLFLERGLDPDFIEQIAAKIPQIQEGANLKYQGQAQRTSGTAGLADLARRGMQLLRELDAILSHQFRRDPALTAAWRSAARVQREPVRSEEAEPSDDLPGSGARSPDEIANNLNGPGVCREQPGTNEVNCIAAMKPADHPIAPNAGIMRFGPIPEVPGTHG